MNVQIIHGRFLSLSFEPFNLLQQLALRPLALCGAALGPSLELLDAGSQLRYLRLKLRDAGLTLVVVFAERTDSVLEGRAIASCLLQFALQFLNLFF